jgi:hypothetical protein
MAIGSPDASRSLMAASSKLSRSVISGGFGFLNECPVHIDRNGKPGEYIQALAHHLAKIGTLFSHNIIALFAKLLKPKN